MQPASTTRVPVSHLHCCRPDYVPGRTGTLEFAAEACKNWGEKDPRQSFTEREPCPLSRWPFSQTMFLDGMSAACPPTAVWQPSS